MEINKNVLVVDDREENLLVLESLLEGLPLNVFRARSGEDALRILLKENIDQIFLDVRMPGMTGIETGRLIKGMSRTKDIPIVFLSGEEEAEYDVLKKEYPDTLEYMLKPVDEAVLRQYLEKYLSIKIEKED